MAEGKASPVVEVHPWQVIERGWRPESVRGAESLFAIGNGRFGQRANFEETYSGDHLRGSYLAGVYYPDKTKVGWWKNGYPEYFAKVLNATNWIEIAWWVNGVEVDLASSEVLEFERILDMKTGLLSRRVRVRLSSGVVVRLEAERFCSMARPDVAAVRMRLVAEDGATVRAVAAVDGNVRNEDSNWEDAFWRMDGEEFPVAGRGLVANTTYKTEFGTATAMSAHLTRGAEARTAQGATAPGRVEATWECSLAAGEEATVTKYIAIATTLHAPAEAVRVAAWTALDVAEAIGYEGLKSEHEVAWAGIWERSDILIEGDVSAQQAIRFNIFHLNATYRGDDARLNIGPKGFTGEKYGGASYWDTEAYCLPFFLASHPAEVARNLLLYRFHHLPRAIENAEKLGFSCGAALYPMVTMNGEECHNEWEITFEEIHRNGAIAYAIYNYVRYTGDEQYLATHGFPVLLGIARFWAQRVNWSEARGAWVMLGVTGPNEYENNVNNNWYTNYLAAWCMRYAADCADLLAEKYPEEFAAHGTGTAFAHAGECRDWRDKAARMYLPVLEGTRVFLQQDGFMDKEQRQAADLRPEERPINQHWSWDRILRSIFIKQADVLQGFYFFPDDFDAAAHEENFDFYEPKTVHESSLSPCVHVVLAARLNRLDTAYDLYLRTARLDLDDYNREVYQGLHITSMAGTWMSVVEGFGGFRVRDGRPEFAGKLPPAWTGLRFRIAFRGRELDVTMDRSSTRVTLQAGEALEVRIDGEVHLIPGR
jgi:maltose phosphorylase